MATCDSGISITDLDLPTEFDDLDGPLRADLQAIISMLSQRAHERLLLTRREYQQLQTNLWNGLAEAINAAVEPLSAECR
jgi:hypothetical protein